MVQKKVCFICKRELPLEEFQIDRSNKDEHHSYCGSCNTKRRRESYRQGNDKTHAERKALALAGDIPSLRYILGLKIRNWGRAKGQTHADSYKGLIIAFELKYGLHVEYVCEMCGRLHPLKNIHFDHQIPLSRNGDSQINNFQMLCRTCSLAKNDLTNSEFIEHIRRVLIYQEATHPATEGKVALAPSLPGV